MTQTTLLDTTTWIAEIVNLTAGGRTSRGKVTADTPEAAFRLAFPSVRLDEYEPHEVEHSDTTLTLTDWGCRFHIRAARTAEARTLPWPPNTGNRR